MGLYHRHKKTSPFALFPYSRQSWYIEILQIKVYSVESQLGLISEDQAESGSEKPALFCGETFQSVIGVCNFESSCFKVWWISIMITGHCAGGMSWFWLIKKGPAAVICESQTSIDFFPYVTLLLPYVTLSLCSSLRVLSFPFS